MFKVPLLKLLITVCIAFFFFGNAYLYAQTISEDSLANKVQLYNRTQPNGVLYLTTDKTLYLPSEVIWFAGYMLDEGAGKEGSLKADILSVSLVKENTTVALRKDYYIANGICAGSLTLPDTIPPGNYQLVACTNIVDAKGGPMQVFSTPITLKTNISTSVATDFDILERPKNDSLFIETHTYTSGAGTPAGKNKNSIEYYFLNQKPRTARLGPLGIATLALPLAEVKASNHILYTVTTFEGSKKYFNLRLPLQAPNSVRVRFYPEGGDLVTGLPGRVAWESSLPDGQPVSAKALLLENGTVRDTLHTDSLGMGLFYLQPNQNCVYALKTINSGNAMPSQVFTLPKALPQGFALGIADAVVNDTLVVNISASNPGTVSLAFTSMLTNASVVSPPLRIEKSRKIRLPLDHISKGLNTITLLDGQGRPVAERLFFAHFNSKNKVEITTDKETYGPRDKITTNVALADAQGKPVSGVFTISCVQLDRLSTDPKKNIEAYYYIEHWLKAGGYNKPIANLYQSRPYIEKLLLVKGWRRYTWQQLMRVNAQTAALSLSKKLRVQGRAQIYQGTFKDPKKEKNVLKKPLMLFAKHDSITIVTETDTKGYFYPKPEELVIREGSPPILFRAFENSMNNDDAFFVTLTDPMENLIRPASYPPVYNYSNAPDIVPQSTKQQQIKGEFLNQQLKEVVIKANPIYHTAGGYGTTNECGDYVCSHNILNCPNHINDIGNHPPVIGQLYFKWNTNALRYVYQGCVLSNIGIIYTTREFYGVDSTGLANPYEKTYLSTLLWKPVVIVPGAGKTVTGFYTSDLRGAYKITIEGVAANGELLYGEKLFTTK